MTDRESAGFAEQGDAPITSLAEDRLGRRRFAQALATEVMAAPVSRGYVMGLTGAWGSGKTSILNMTVDALGSDAIVVQFNPWMFSGTEALVSFFFDEIGRQLEASNSKLKEIAGKLSTYGRLLSPLAAVVGAATAVSGAADVLDKLAEKPSVFEQRQKIRSRLADLDKRLVVIVDDVDRLREPEVLDIVRLVRLVGDFPNTLYLLAFDRGRVEECLGQGNLARGRAYLEKIVQVTHDVPAARAPDVISIFLDGISDLIGAETGPLDAQDWQNIFAFVIRPLLFTPRQVRRLVASLSMTIRLLGDEVALADLIGIEAIRVLDPAMFEALVSVADHLSAQRSDLGGRSYQPGRSGVDSPLAPMFAVNPELAKDICRWLFPAARKYFENMHHGPEWESIWKAKRKVASSDVLRFYLERQLPEGVVPARVVDLAIESLQDRDALQALLDSSTPAQLVDLIERMNQSFDHAQQPIGADAAVVALPVLLDLLGRLPESHTLLGMDGPMVVMRAALRLLERIDDSDRRTEVARKVLSATKSRSGQLICLLVAGHRDNIGTGQIDAVVAQELENQLREDLVAMTAEDFAAEAYPVRLASLMAETEQGRQALVALVEHDRVMLALFIGASGETRAQAMGAVAVEITKTLSWDQLGAWVGEETLVRRTAELLAAVQDDGFTVTAEEMAVLDLACDYATGNRPESPFDRVVRTQNTGQPAPDPTPAAHPGQSLDSSSPIDSG